MEKTDMTVLLGMIALCVVLAFTGRSCQINSDQVRERVITACLQEQHTPLECGHMFK